MLFDLKNHVQVSAFEIRVEDKGRSLKELTVNRWNHILNNIVHSKKGSLVVLSNLPSLHGIYYFNVWWKLELIGVTFV